MILNNHSVTASLGRRSGTGGRRPGYIFLISVLVIGAIASTTAISLVLLGLAAEQSGLNIVQATQAYELAQTCAERALLSLRSDLAYDGNETFALTGGSCTIQPVTGFWNENRGLCVEGHSANVVRRFEVDVLSIYPSVRVASWKEVEAFTLCP